MVYCFLSMDDKNSKNLPCSKLKQWSFHYLQRYGFCKFLKTLTALRKWLGITFNPEICDKNVNFSFIGKLNFLGSEHD